MCRCLIERKNKFITVDKYVMRTIAGETVLVSVGDGVADFCGIIQLNSTARIIWEKLITGASAEELTNTLLSEFDVSKEKAETDVIETLKILSERKMITYAE